MNIAKFTSYTDFESASRAVLAFLHQRLGFELWMVTRTEGDDWIVLQAEDHGYGVKDGDVFLWADSFCSQMVQGLGPCIAPKSDLIPAYAAAPIGKQVNIGAYVGVPISDADGSLFGTLCAIDPNAQSESLRAELPLIELLGQMLSCLLVSELKLITNQRRHERNASNTTTDPETGLLSVVGWTNVIEAEEQRCRVYGHSACVILIRLNERQPDSKHVSDVSQALRACLGPNDLLARIEHNLFGVIGPERNAEQGNALLNLVKNALSPISTSSRISLVNRDPRTGLQVASEKSKKLVSE